MPETLFNKMNLQKENYRYLLVDPLSPIWNEHKISLNLIREKLPDNAICPVLRADLSYLPESCPHLIMLAQPGQECEDVLLKQSIIYSQAEIKKEKRYVCGWLTSDLDIRQLAEFIAEKCSLLGDNITLGYTLPYFEPLRLSLLQIMVSPKSWLCSEFGSINNWWYINIPNQLGCIKGNKLSKRGRINGEAVQVQLQFSVINRLLITWSRLSAQNNKLLPENAVEQAVEQIIQAGDMGLKNLEDKIAFSLNRLTVYPRMECNPEIQQAIKIAAGSNQVRLTTLLNELPDSVWKECPNNTDDKS